MAQRRPITLLRPAETLKEAAITLEPAPLESKEEQAAFYRDGINKARGVNRMRRIEIQLTDAIESERPYKAFVMGHPGVGKTTDLLRLAESFDDRLKTLYISVNSELNPGAFRYYDVLLLILVRLVESCSSPTVIGHADNRLNLLLRRVYDCLHGKWQDYLQTRESTFEAGADVWLAKIKWTLKQGRTSKKGEERFEASFVADLVDLMNDVFIECNDLLNEYQKKQWLIIVDDFEKLGMEESPLTTLFSGLRPCLQALDANFIFVIPVWLHFSTNSQAILPSNFVPCVLPDLPIYTRLKRPDEATFEALRDVIHARLRPELLDDGVIDQCIRASGGSLRDLFTLIRTAAITARLRDSATISMADSSEAIQELRNEYKLRLGSTASTDPAVTLDKKIERLVEIYKRETDQEEVPDPVPYDLLRQKFVLHYNGAGWMGIHSLAVDLLIQFKALPQGSPGGSAN